jgi:hypothetical protein
LGVNTAPLVEITFHPITEQDVCGVGVGVQPAPEPVFVEGNLIVRSGNQKRKLSAREAIAYQKQH